MPPHTQVVVWAWPLANRSSARTAAGSRSPANPAKPRSRHTCPPKNPH